MYFAYCPNDGFETFATAEEAKKRAELHLEHYRDDAASDGWNEQVDQVCWGEITFGFIATVVWMTDFIVNEIKRKRAKRRMRRAWRKRSK